MASRFLRRGLGALLLQLAMPCLPCAPAAAASLSFTVAASEPVTVTGTPRIAIDVGGVTRYATYASGSGTSSLTFSYAVQPGDFDGNGIALASPVELNGGSIIDVAGNPASALTFTLPDTSAIKVQTYTAAFTTSPITNANANAVSFAIAKAPTGASFDYTITSGGGAGSVAGSGTISGSPHSISGIDVSALPSGTLTLSVTVSTAAGGTGAARTASAVPLFSGAIDGMSAAAAYATRRLSSSYTGPLLRVRRSSDNAMQDIGATAIGDLNMATLTSFCGSVTCYVVTMFDQSGNARDALQPSAGNQPLIVTSGSPERLGARPGVRFSTSAWLAGPDSLSSANEFTLSMASVERARQSNATWKLLVSEALSPRVLALMPWTDGNLYYDIGSSTAPNRLFVAWPVPIGTPAIVTFQNSASANTRGIYLNGALLRSGPGAAADSDIVEFGRRYLGHVSEFILFPNSISSSARLDLERNQGSYYGITVP